MDPVVLDAVVRRSTAGDVDAVVAFLTASWGGTVVVGHGTVYDAATLPGLVAESGGRMVGLLTYHADDESGLEVVTIDAARRGAGVGTALLAAAVELARTLRLPRVWLVTTNDNLDALRFYQRRGMRITSVAPGAVDAARALKPTIPMIGAYGIELHDELVLELPLSSG